MNKDKRTSILIFAATILFFMFIFLLPKISEYTFEKTGISEAPDTSFFYTGDDLYNIAGDYGEDGRKTYIFMRWTFDLVWPIVYTAFLAAWIWKLSTYLKIKKIYFIPIIAMIFDYLENIGSTIVFSAYPNEIHMIASITPWMSMLKWSILGVSFVILFLLMIISAYKFLRSR